MGTKGWRQFKWEDRLQLEVLLRAGHSKTEIAQLLHCDRSTIYNEIKRGQYMHTNSDLTEELRYSPDIAQRKYEENLKVRGTQLKIGNDIEYAEYLEHKICDENYSPSAVLGELQETGKAAEFKTTICPTTLYSYIDKGIFLRLTNQDLPVKKDKKRDYKQVQRQKRAQAGESITNRPEEIDTREEFGHWEMDTVIGKRGKSKHSLLVLTERKTREEIIFLLEQHTAAAVVARVDQLERKWGELFYKVFKSITVDNGTEFSDYEGLSRSAVKEGSRTDVYYCHPYSSWERGSNENQNKLVRRFVPKSTNFDDRSEGDIQIVEDWMNDYPRKIFGWKRPQELFDQELKMLG